MLLVVLNIRTYDKVLEFEQTLNNQVTVRFKNASKSPRVRNGSNVTNVSENNLEMAQLMPKQPENQPENPDLLTRLKSVRKSNLLSVEQHHHPEQQNQSQRSSLVQAASCENAIVSGHGVSDLRRREVVLAKISIYMVFVFLICHSVKIVPNIYEMVQTYLVVSRV